MNYDDYYMNVRDFPTRVELYRHGLRKDRITYIWTCTLGWHRRTRRSSGWIRGMWRHADDAADALRLNLTNLARPATLASFVEADFQHTLARGCDGQLSQVLHESDFDHVGIRCNPRTQILNAGRIGQLQQISPQRFCERGFIHE